MPPSDFVSGLFMSDASWEMNEDTFYCNEKPLFLTEIKAHPEEIASSCQPVNTKPLFQDNHVGIIHTAV